MASVRFVPVLLDRVGRELQDLSHPYHGSGTVHWCGTQARCPRDELAALTEELRRARQDLDQFTHFISHDFGAPLRHIVGFSKLLEKEFGDHENGDIATWLGFMGAVRGSFNTS
jgi:signal transduction histidine kinase